jgi:hypothetical protein
MAEGVSTVKNFLRPRYEGPGGSEDGEGLEEAFAALLVDALAVLLSGGEHGA